MTLSDLREAVRRRLDDLAEPYGWADDDLDAWINEAIREAALRGRLNRGAVTVSVVAGTASYALAATVDYIHTAKMTTGSIPLTRTSRDELDACMGGWSTVTGTPTAFFVENRTLTLYPNPSANGTLTLVVDVIPSALTSDSQSPTLETQDHLPLLEWVIYRAGQQRDRDATIPNPEIHEAAFTRYFGPRPSARTRRMWLESGAASFARPF